MRRQGAPWWGDSGGEEDVPFTWGRAGLMRLDDDYDGEFVSLHISFAHT